MLRLFFSARIPTNAIKMDENKKIDERDANGAGYSLYVPVQVKYSSVTIVLVKQIKIHILFGHI